MHSATLTDRHPSTSSTFAETSEISLEVALSIWWSCTWRTLVVGMLVIAVVGLILGIWLGLIGHADLAPVVGELLGWLISIPANIWALFAALRRHHNGRAVALVRA